MIATQTFTQFEISGTIKCSKAKKERGRKAAGSFV
jgi:hypothetical protein